MTAFHPLPDYDVRPALTPGLLEALGPRGVEQALRFAGTVEKILGQRSCELASAQVMAAYGGGKDSSYLLMFVRAAQQLLLAQRGETFNLLIATYVQNGMTEAVFSNILRCFDRLGIAGDERVAVKTVVDGNAVDFSPEKPIPPSTQLRDRNGILVAGHQTQGQARPTFCHRCNFDMVTMMKTVAVQLKADIVVTGDSPREQAQYAVWTDWTSRQLGLARPRRDFLGVLDGVESIGRHVDRTVHGESATAAVVADTPDAPPVYLSAFQFTPYDAGKHRAALRYLDFRFDSDSFVGTESDCANPLLMFHLRGLRAEHVLGVGYEQGAREYIRLWQELMRAKNIPLDLIDRFLGRFTGQASIAARRADAARFAAFAYGLSEEALVAMVYSPFASNGRNLKAWLSRELPALAPAESEIRASIVALREDELTEALAKITCLSLRQMHHLWGCELVTPLYKLPGQTEFLRESGSATPIAILLSRDPHQVEIATRLGPDGPEVLEILSGR
jgi:hypothetical protein